MQELPISKDIFTSFAGTTLALLSAGIIWFLKSAYEKHRSEKLALANFERIFAINLTTLKDNFEFVDNWISALNTNRPYSFHLEKYFIDDETTFRLSNLELINSIISANYMLRRASSDLENIYRGYWEIFFKIDAMPDPTQKEENLRQYHSTVINALGQIKKNHAPLRNAILETVALVRSVDHVRFHSLFGYLGLLFVDIFPRVTKKLKWAEMEKLRQNIQKNSKRNYSEENQDTTGKSPENPWGSNKGLLKSVETSQLEKVSDSEQDLTMNKFQFIINNFKLPLAFVAFILGAYAIQPNGFTNNPHFPNLVLVEPFARLTLYAGAISLLFELIDRLLDKHKNKQLIISLCYFALFFFVSFLIFRFIAAYIFVQYYCNGTMEGCFILNYY